MRNLVVTLLLSAVVAACATSNQARSTETTGFLGEHRSLLRPGQKGKEALLTYTKPGVNWAGYKKILLEPVAIWSDPKNPLPPEQEADLKQLVDSFYATLRQKLSADYELVDRPGPGTLRIQAAITNGMAANTTMKLASKAVPYGGAASALWTFTTGKPAFAGEVSIEFMVKDGQSGELLGAGADRRVGTDSLNKEALNSWADVKNSLEFWSDAAVYRLCVLRGAAGCVEPKNSPVEMPAPPLPGS